MKPAVDRIKVLGRHEFFVAVVALEKLDRRARIDLDTGSARRR